MLDHKYEIQVRETDKPIKISNELKGKLTGISPKLISKMKREIVECPVLGKPVSFIQCYFCPNFVRRVKGIVHCRGNPLGG
ncbi:MAG: hypothetical protein QXY49_07090 [Thermofilaceae archaeon]